jgi:fatty-acyl-CoA synthase
MNIPLTPLRYLRYAEEQYPRRVGIVCGDKRFTYGEYADRSYRLAGALREIGIKPGERVAFIGLNCHRLLEAYYGVLEAGAVLLPMNVRLAPHELAYILNDSGSKVLFLERQFLEMVDSFRASVPSIETYCLLDAEPEAAWLLPKSYDNLLETVSPYRSDILAIDEDAVAELFYTSGTSANPKGVMLTHRNIYLHALQVAVAHAIERGSAELHTIPLFHANGWGVPHFLTMLGGKHVMMRRFDPPEVFRLVEKEQVDAFSVVPTMAAALLHCPDREKYNLSSLKRVSIGGAASSPTLVREVEEKLNCHCYSGYGLTETSPALTLSSMKPGLDWQGEQRFIGQAMTGFANPGVELRVVDPNDQDVSRDGVAIGEVVARGDGVMKGYWKQPEATAEALRGGWFHTGDMAVWREDGYILIVDRKKDIIVSGGENISSLEIEKALAAHPAIYEAAIVPVPDEKWGEVPKALVVLKPGANATEAELLEFCRANLSHYKCPRSVEFFESLPKTGTGKILKKELRKKYWLGQDSIRPEAVEQKEKVSKA